MKRIPWACGVGFAASLLLLSTGLPLRDVSTVGQLSTIMLYVLNPPTVVVAVLAPHGAHDLEESSWPKWEYPVMAVVSAGWWFCVGLIRVAVIRWKGIRAAARSGHSGAS